MKPTENKANGMAWEGSGDRARQVMREYRSLLTGYAPVPDLEKKPARKAGRTVHLPLHFTSRRVTVCTFDPLTHERDCERIDVWPIVFAQLDSPYGRVRVNTGL